ncbi:hypothetical protein T484DRAFT_1765405 [Baffinella frigidus]|nr:hypothetical protein T484DRAFT_1765405 [Cryptophyta sp. CCMP2293]
MAAHRRRRRDTGRVLQRALLLLSVAHGASSKGNGAPDLLEGVVIPLEERFDGGGHAWLGSLMRALARPQRAGDDRTAYTNRVNERWKGSRTAGKKLRPLPGAPPGQLPMSSGQFERRQQFAPLESGQRRPLPRDLETGNGRGHGAGSPLTPSAAIITVQDCESSVGLTAAFTMPESFEVLRLQVASRFQYTNVMLYLPSGEQAKTLAVIPTDDLILSTDGKPRQPNGDASAQQHSMRSLPHLSSDRTVDTLESTTQPGPHDVSSGEPMVLEDLWGWRKIGQLVGGKVASEKAMRSWRNSGTAASLIFVIEFMSFSYPPTPVGRRGLDDATWHENPGTQVALRAYFWFSALGMIFGLFALLMATVMSMQV